MSPLPTVCHDTDVLSPCCSHCVVAQGATPVRCGGCRVKAASWPIDCRLATTGLHSKRHCVDSLVHHHAERQRCHQADKSAADLINKNTVCTSFGGQRAAHGMCVLELRTLRRAGTLACVALGRCNCERCGRAGPNVSIGPRIWRQAPAARLSHWPR
eukprot:207752-Chlamydomonas_euryale.AAC.1